MKYVIFFLIFLLLTINVNAVAVAPAQIEISVDQLRDIHITNNANIKMDYEINNPEWIDVSVKRFSLEPEEKRIIQIRTKEYGKEGLILVEEYTDKISNAVAIKIKSEQKTDSIDLHNIHFISLSIIIGIVVIILIIFNKKIKVIILKIINKLKKIKGNLFKYLKFFNKR